MCSGGGLWELPCTDISSDWRLPSTWFWVGVFWKRKLLHAASILQMQMKRDEGKSRQQTFTGHRESQRPGGGVSTTPVDTHRRRAGGGWRVALGAAGGSSRDRLSGGPRHPGSRGGGPGPRKHTNGPVFSFSVRFLPFSRQTRIKTKHLKCIKQQNPLDYVDFQRYTINPENELKKAIHVIVRVSLECKHHSGSWLFNL